MAIDLGSLKSRTISGIPDDLIEQFDLIAKRVVGNRSVMIKIMMKCVVENARAHYEREAKTEQFVTHAVNDTFKMFGIDLPRERSRDLTTAAV
jgi:metal-responsive CopG/Arc/MetJ family transcriptional regulator